MNWVKNKSADQVGNVVVVYYVYMLKCCDKSYYTGYTVDLDKRMEAHEQGKGSKYVRSRSPFKLVYHEKFRNQKKALQREYAIKQLKRTEKELLIKVEKKKLKKL